MSFKFDDSDMMQKMDSLGTKLGVAILMYANTKAVQLESKMKKKRPWTDRTEMAKATLRARVSMPDSHTIRITLSHGVSYGIWLELANGKKYAIVAPTIKAESPKIVEDLAGILDKVKV